MEQEIKQWNAQSKEYKIVNRKFNTLKNILFIFGVLFLLLLLFGVLVYALYPEALTETIKNNVLTLVIRHEVTPETLQLIKQTINESINELKWLIVYIRQYAIGEAVNRSKVQHIFPSNPCLII